MASKSSTVILPLVLGLCAWWVEGRWNWRTMVRAAALLVLAIPAVAMTILTQGVHPATTSDPQLDHSWPARLAEAGYAVWFYLGKLIWPHPLIAVYPSWKIDVHEVSSYLPLLAVGFVLVVLWVRRDAWSRPYFFAFSYYLVAMLPELALADSYITDHYQYLSSMGPLALAGAGLAQLADAILPGRARARMSLGAGVLLVLAAVSWQRTWIYQSEVTLWTDALSKYPTCWVGYNNLGNALMRGGAPRKRKRFFLRALELNPKFPAAIDNLGVAYFDEGRIDESIGEYQKVLEERPDFVAAYEGLATDYLKRKQIPDAAGSVSKGH